MTGLRHSTLFFLVPLCAIFAAGRGAAIAPQIKDEGKFFSPAAVQKANEQIREIATSTTPTCSSRPTRLHRPMSWKN